MKHLTIMVTLADIRAAHQETMARVDPKLRYKERQSAARLERCYVPNPLDRAICRELLEDGWTTRNIDYAYRRIEVVCKTRSGAVALDDAGNPITKTVSVGNRVVLPLTVQKWLKLYYAEGIGDPIKFRVVDPREG